MSSKVSKVSGFTKEHPAAELHAAGRLTGVLFRLMLLNALAALFRPPIFPSFVHSTAKRPFLLIY